jgi:hypothetical protein
MHAVEGKTFKAIHVSAAITKKTAGCILPLLRDATSSVVIAADATTVRMNHGRE